MLPLLAITALAGPPETPNRCLRCHPPNVAGHLNDWDQSVHARAGITCRTCHPADRDPFFHEPANDPKARQAAILVTCNACHADVTTEFLASPHHLSRGVEQPTCASCHSTAGGSVLDSEALAAQCGKCHDATHLRRALALLDSLRRVTLARSLVSEALERLRKLDRAVADYEEALAAINANYAGVAREWHRFDFDTAEQHTRAALRALERLHERLEAE